jgi:hypothetical protein
VRPLHWTRRIVGSQERLDLGAKLGVVATGLVQEGRAFTSVERGGPVEHAAHVRPAVGVHRSDRGSGLRLIRRLSGVKDPIQLEAHFTPR